MVEKKLKKNFSFLFSENILRLGLGFFISVWMARHLGPEGYGKFTYVISLINLFLPLYILGSDEVVTKFFLIEKENLGSTVGTGFSIKLIGALLSIIIINCISFSLRPNEPLMKMAILFYSISMGFQAFGVINNYYQSRVEENRTSILRNFVFIPITGLKVLWIIEGNGWESFIWLSCAEVVIVALLYLVYFSKNHFSPVKWNFDRGKFQKMLSLCLPFFMVLFLEQAIFKIDQLMVGEMLGDDALGQYGAANKLVNLWNFIPIAFVSTLFPTLLEGFNEGQKQYAEVKRLLLGGLFWFSLIFALAVTSFGGLVVDVMYGEKYSQTGSLLRLYSWVTILSYFTMARSKLLLVQGDLFLNVIIMLVISLTNIVLNYFLIPSYGAWGAIYATILSLFLGILLMIFDRSGRELLYDFYKGVFIVPIKVFGKQR